MKLLGWMHRKFRQNSNEPIKDFNTGQPPLDDPYYSHNLSYGMKSCKQLHSDHYLHKYFVGLGADTVEEEDDCQGDSSAAVSEFFHGFLAIGTLGSENGLSTPTFPNPVENITEKEDTEATETELKLINDELEKVLAAEAKDDTWCSVSSGRTSHVSAGRSSHGSTITLGGRGSTSTMCPLQDFLFGSAIEMSETTALAKKENRTTLGELFQRNKIAEDGCRMKLCDDEEVSEKEVDRSTVILVKEKLKKILHSSSSRNSDAASGIKNDSISPEKTLNKILHVFHRKIHPDTSASGKKIDKQQRKKKQNSNKGCKGVNVVINGEDVGVDPQRDTSKETMQQKSHCNPNLTELNGNRECWIKTDADCHRNHSTGHLDHSPAAEITRSFSANRHLTAVVLLPPELIKSRRSLLKILTVDETSLKVFDIHMKFREDDDKKWKSRVDFSSGSWHNHADFPSGNRHDSSVFGHRLGQ